MLTMPTGTGNRLSGPFTCSGTPLPFLEDGCPSEEPLLSTDAGQLPRAFTGAQIFQRVRQKGLIK